MKMTQAMHKAQDNMKAGVITAEGFLGDEKISIRDMIARDEGEMVKAGLDYVETAEKLSYFLKEGKNGLGEPVTVDENWLVQVVDPRGQLACPFEDGIYHKATAEIILKATGEKFIVTDLSIHLFLEHHFIEGIGSQFRLDPHVVKRVLFPS